MDIPKIEKYLPWLMQLTRYAFILLCLVVFAPRIITLLDATEQRLASGGEVSIGVSGVKFGEAPKMPVPTKSLDRYAGLSGIGNLRTGSGGVGLGGTGTTTTDPVIQSAPFRSGAPTKGMLASATPEDLLHLVHGAAKQGPDYIVKVRLESTDASLMEDVQKVIYHLHSSFNPPTREVTDRSTGFELSFTAWGQFEVKADIYLKGRRSPVRIGRWLNF